MCNIVEIAIPAGSSKTPATTVQSTELAESLSGARPFTGFAPTSQAFVKLPAGTVESLLKDVPKLKQVLTYHVVPGKVMAADVAGKTTAVATVEGSQVHVNGKHGVRVNGARVVKADIVADNGVIHVIDKVLLPK